MSLAGPQMLSLQARPWQGILVLRKVFLDLNALIMKEYFHVALLIWLKLSYHDAYLNFL
jgi:hypothetical protein